MKRYVMCLLFVLGIVLTVAACASPSSSGPAPTPTRYPSTAVIGGQLFQVDVTRVKVSGIGLYGPGCARPNPSNEVVVGACLEWELEGTYYGVVKAIEEDGFWNKDDIIRVLLDNGKVRWYHGSQTEVQPFPPTVTPTHTPAPTNTPVSVIYPAAPSGKTCFNLVVQKDYTLHGIANAYGTTVQVLQKDNNITNPTLIYIGQILSVCLNKH